MTDTGAARRAVRKTGVAVAGDLVRRVLPVAAASASDDLAAPASLVVLPVASVAAFDRAEPLRVLWYTPGAGEAVDAAQAVYVVLVDAAGNLIDDYLWNDDFADIDPNPLAARPGFTITDAAAKLATDGHFLVASGGSTNWGDTSDYHTASMARSALGCVAALVRFSVDSGSLGLFLTSALNPANPLTADRGVYYNYPDLRVVGVTQNTLQRPGTRLYMIDYLLCAFPRTGGGCFYVVSGGQFGQFPSGRIAWIDDDDAQDPVFAGIANGSGVQRVDYLRALAPNSAGTLATQRFGQALAAYQFTTVQGNANGYVAEVGGQALTVWTGAAQTTGGKLQSTSAASMRARYAPGGTPHIWKATFTTPASVVGCEIYLDFRDNGTSRLSAVLDTTKAYIFDGYASLTLSNNGGVTLQPSTTYRLAVHDYPTGECVMYINDVMWISTTGANGLAGTQGGVTTVGAGIGVDDVACWPLVVTLPTALAGMVVPPAATGSALFTDAFTDTAATAIAAHNAGWSNQAYSGGGTPTFVIDGTGTKAVQSGANDIGGFAIRAGGAGSDHHVQADVTIPSSDLGGFRCGVVARWTDNGNYIAARFLNQGSSDEIEVWQHVAGVTTLVAAVQIGNLTNSSTHALALAVRGVDVAVYMDGNLVGQGVTTLTTGTSVGFGCEDTPTTGTAAYDNFAVKGAA